MNCQNTSLLRIVRGNAFKLKIAVEAYTPSGRKVESFSVDEAELKLYKNGTLTAREYTIIEGTTILVEFDGSDALGVYGFQMSGIYEGEAWRWANWNVFQIVETNEKAYIPDGCVVLEDTYLIGVKIALSNGDFTQEQADWDETNPESPAYIQNKPDLSRYLTSAYELLTVGVTLDSTSGKYTFDTPLYGLLDSAWSAGKIPVLRLRDSSSQQIRIIATIPMFPGGVTGNASFYGSEQKGETKYVFAYVGSLTQAANSYAKVVDVQSAISDLDAIRSGAALGATALQEAFAIIDGGEKTKMGTTYNFTTGTITAIKNAWDAGKVPVLVCTLVDDDVKFVAVISKNAENKFFGEFFVNSTRYQFTSLEYSQFATGSIGIYIFEETTNKTTDISANKTSTTKYPSTKGVADYVDGIVGDINTILDNINGEVI